MSNDQVSSSVAGRAPQDVCASAAVVKVLILLGLVAWAFHNELRKFVWVAGNTSDWAHVLVVPFGVLLLAWLRRHELRAALTNGSPWGVLLLLLGFGLHAICLWPFQYAYIREAAIVPVCGGVVLAICGWRVLKRSLPMLLLLSLSIPLGPRIYSALIIRPETYTLASARFMLDQLPGAQVELDGPDLDVTKGGSVATVALGEPHRGASLLAIYVAIGVFVVFRGSVHYGRSCCWRWPPVRWPCCATFPGLSAGG